MNKENSKNIKVCSFKISNEDLDRIDKVSIKKGMSRSDYIRSLLLDSLNEEIAKDNIDVVRKVIHDEIFNVISPLMERMIALQVKACIHSATGGYLNAETIARLLPDELQEPFEVVYEKARKKAVLSIKEKESEREQMEN